MLIFLIILFFTDLVIIDFIDLTSCESIFYLLVGGVEVLKKYNIFKNRKTASQTKFNS